MEAMWEVIWALDSIVTIVIKCVGIIALHTYIMTKIKGDRHERFLHNSIQTNSGIQGSTDAQGRGTISNRVTGLFKRK